MEVEIEILKYGCATGVATSPASHQMDFIANKIFGGGISRPVLEFKVKNMQGVAKRCRLSWLTNSALVYEPKCEGREGAAALRGLSQ